MLIQHMDPAHESQLANLLSKSSQMPVIEVTGDMPVEIDHVYIIPPWADLCLSGDTLKLITRQKKAKPPFHLPIDLFFTSLANNRKENAIGVILSGTGADGAKGLLAIKSKGGRTFVQEATSAQYPDMPKAAMATSKVDYVLSCEDIAKELSHLSLKGDPFQGEEDQLEAIFKILKEDGTDFGRYKPSTIHRRIHRQMESHQITSLSDYVSFLQRTPGEKESLRCTLLINVTHFFRDPKVFDVLKEKVFPEISKGRSTESPVRIWVPGCSTGEEVYSLAIALLESMDTSHGFPIQIFGSDISEPVLNKARAGVYPTKKLSDITPGQLKRFFTQVKGGYQINKMVRELCVFAIHDLTRNPPFSRMDLISCRNLLIYLGPKLWPQAPKPGFFHFPLCA
ncbi:MAG: CheR family methyltransferase [bacterium]|nr:CheR family methyltransferase [bacterium]